MLYRVNRKASLAIAALPPRAVRFQHEASPGERASFAILGERFGERTVKNGHELFFLAGRTSMLSAVSVFWLIHVLFWAAKRSRKPGFLPQTAGMQGVFRVATRNFPSFLASVQDCGIKSRGLGFGMDVALR